MARASQASGRGAILGLSTHRALREGALWIFTALALILFAALATYEPQDPGFSFTGADERVTNAIGPVG
ncbi:MAG: DNA translocase FtsK 4TM domain-containing protein, partial [Gammaproteobacteria bacterium]